METIVIGCDFHSRFQQIAMLEPETGEIRELRLEHPEEAHVFYRGLAPGAVIGVEASSPAVWFERLLGACGHKLVVGDAGKIKRAATPGKKNDKRDAGHLLDLLVKGSFPEIWWADEAIRDRRVLLRHRHNLVKMRVRVELQLRALGRKYGLTGGHRLSQRYQAKLNALELPIYQAELRRGMLELHADLESRIAVRDGELAKLAAQDEAVQRLMSFPGVGPVTALYLRWLVGDPGRFASGDALANYLGLVPSQHSSAGRQILGRITRQGSRMGRWLLVEAGQAAARFDPELKRFYLRMAARKGRPKAKIAVARKLAVYLLLMWKRGWDYPQWRAHAAPTQAGPVGTVSLEG